ncbi:MAG: PEP-CTERM sorting domain-containing protein [Rhodocyclaceae bacterium]|nr:MAG: PEP-CTERM sorting domain-containing protein [Rhodocyclaceae bacterium]
MKLQIALIGTLTVAAISPLSANAGVVTGGGLLSNSAADQLENWLGSGDLNFTNIWSGTVGASSISWHASVDNAGPTLSIYDISVGTSRYLIGGYTDNNWYRSGSPGYQADNDAFIFNLTTGIVKRNSESLSSTAQYAIYAAPGHFATFGGGHDIYGGENILGAPLNGWAFPGFSYGPYLAGNIINGDPSVPFFTVNSLETYTFAPAPQSQDLPAPTPLALIGLGVAGIWFGRRSKRE